MWGTAPGVHWLTIFLQTKREDTMFGGLVANFTSVKPFAQAEADTNHKKAKAAVTKRSLGKKQWSELSQKTNHSACFTPDVFWTETIHCGVFLVASEWHQLHSFIYTTLLTALSLKILPTIALSKYCQPKWDLLIYSDTLLFNSVPPPWSIASLLINGEEELAFFLQAFHQNKLKHGN